MKLSCPVCSRQTDVDRDIGDFLTRCNCCRSLVRFPATASSAPAASAEPAPAKVAVAATPAVSPEVRHEMDRIRTRRTALARAAQKGRLEAMGTLGWIGLGVAAVLAVIAISAKAQNLLGHPATASAESVVMR